MNIEQLLKYAIQQKASDLHLAEKLPPMIRVDGDLCIIPDTEPLSHDPLMQLLLKMMNDNQQEWLKNHFELDFSLDLPKISRCRVNIFQAANGINAALRLIPLKIPSLEQLDMPEVLKELCSLPHGLVLITGPTGCGKSTTLAAMIDYINQARADHILTLEDPIEFIYPNKKCLIQQREIHHHTANFNDALRAALREDPDVILVGEMRDIETIRLALTAAETGHLVLATLHTSSAAKTINRVIDVFPAAEKELVRTLLAESLQAVMAQRLLKRKNGGRIAAHEILICSPAVRSLIRENKSPQIDSAIQTGRSLGMHSLDQHIKELLELGLIESMN